MKKPGTPMGSYAGTPRQPAQLRPSYDDDNLGRKRSSGAGGSTFSETAARAFDPTNKSRTAMKDEDLEINTPEQRHRLQQQLDTLQVISAMQRVRLRIFLACGLIACAALVVQAFLGPRPPEQTLLFLSAIAMLLSAGAATWWIEKRRALVN